MVRWSISGLGSAVVAGTLVIVCTLVGYRFLRADVSARVYRNRLGALAGDYESLRWRYNDAVRRTAVAELLVRDGRLSVRVRTIEGVVREIETPFNPAGEVYVDYAVVDGRLWIRRVFDAATPPGLGLVIDPALASVDWEKPGATYGKAVYRTLSEGRWVVSVTGDGSLGLTRADEPTDLAAAPPVKDFAELTDETDARLRRMTPAEVLRAVLAPDGE
jgi:hypothetical protein